jgi:predicted kinase
MKKLILIRGLPGSGKSTVASQIAYACEVMHIETDMFWGKDYKFDVSRLGEAHQWCLETAKKYLIQEFDVVVSNTFTTKKELKPYFDMAKSLGATPQIILCQGAWGSIHNVPQETLNRMAARFEYDIAELYD